MSGQNKKNRMRRGRGGVSSPRNPLPRPTAKKSSADGTLIAPWSDSVDAVQQRNSRVDR